MKPLSITCLLAITSIASASQSISSDDARIQTLGTKYIKQTEFGTQYQRHCEDVLQSPRKELGINPDKARNTSGIVLAFNSDSKAITAHFDILAANYMGSGFGVFENGVLIEELKLTPKEKTAALKFSSKSKGSSLFEIALPSFANVAFKGLTIDDGADLQQNPALDKRIYVALGDSISHGVGQDGATHKTWPFLLSRQLNAEVFNLAVGGGKISVPTAAMLSDWEQIDLITVLIGYNDLHFDGKTPAAYAAKYNELLDTIRTNHPNTQIYCISLLYTDKPTAKSGHTADEFRAALTQVITQRKSSDKHLFLVRGDSITSKKNLRADNDKDPVHLGVEGAAMLANELAAIIQQ
ncbi:MULTISPECIES: SGNH/GDSL hydrolase family protein [unclassified Lentimonas]|uniref:SGNH/GDSL hydrolase family protein n=1 Tax=unclassified Lentimonas TaxID=2630993 RepID=UPI001328110D|nr:MULTISPECIES: SGNH/GDSL hydrolase family protein [unclassified Lentimonas]CAA6691226.1 Unannotated [Lentimonas sp. CC19]CAA6694816.1 Unannotated [Lentimonas sp. CC10]CAA7071604.1 Unannotated [Lentimonas sp. CC11]